MPYCEPLHIHHSEYDVDAGLIVLCRECTLQNALTGSYRPVYHHADYVCLNAGRRFGTIRHLDDPPEITEPQPEIFCDTCDEYHGPECPSPLCDSCDMYHSPDDSCEQWWCQSCQEFHPTGEECPNRYYCDYCCEYHHENYECDGAYESEYDYRDYSGRDMLLDSSDNPAMKFHGHGPAFYGMEIEVSSRRIADAVEAAQILDTRALLFFKEDCSVDGFEMVTHPMSYDFAMNEFPWEVLQEFENHGCSIDRYTNGIHVHVSRKAFKDDAHAYRWMKLFYRNQEYVTAIARRDSRWGHFSDSHRLGQCDHLKAHKAIMQGNYTKARAFNDTTRERYSVINTTNQETFEVRVFASTLNIREAQACLQLVAAGVEYTRDLTIKDIAEHEAWTWPAFGVWLNAQEGKYRALADATNRYDTRHNARQASGRA